MSQRDLRRPASQFLPITLAALVGTALTVALVGCGSENATQPDPDLMRFAAAKRAQAMELARAETNPVPVEVWRFFDAVQKNRWHTATNRFEQLRAKFRPFGPTPQTSPTGIGSAVRRLLQELTGAKAQQQSAPRSALHGPLWVPVLETFGALEQFHDWDGTLLRRFGRGVISSIPTNSIYFGGNDAGRFVITALTESPKGSRPFFVITQNALADGTYLDYLRQIYGGEIYIPTTQDSQTAFSDYLKDAQQRLQAGKLKPGEDVRTVNNRVQVSGQVAVMQINGLLVKRIFDQNPEHQFFVEESFPLDWMYPYLSPHGLILKLNREPVSGLSEPVMREDRDYWQQLGGQLLGDWLRDDTSLKEVSDFIEKVHLRKDLGSFRGDPAFARNAKAQKTFSKLRSAIGGLYAWRAEHAGTPAEKTRMRKEADFAFLQSFALCPYSPEAVFRYVQLLLAENKPAEAVLVAQTCLRLDPGNSQLKALLQQLEKMTAK